MTSLELFYEIEAAEAVVKRYGISAEIPKARDIHVRARRFFSLYRTLDTEWMWARSGLIYGATLAKSGRDGWQRLAMEIKLDPEGDRLNSFTPSVEAAGLFGLMVSNYIVVLCLTDDTGSMPIYTGRARRAFGMQNASSFAHWHALIDLAQAFYIAKHYPMSNIVAAKNLAGKALDILVNTAPGSELQILAEYIVGESSGYLPDGSRMAFFSPNDIFHYEVDLF